MLTICAGRTHSEVMDLAKLKTVPITARGDRTDRWLGVQHGELVETIHTALRDLFGFTPLNPLYYVSPNGASLIGGFELGKPDPDDAGQVYPVLMCAEPQEVCASIGFTHSNDSRTALRVTGGGRVFLCENGVAAGDYKIERRHTNKLRLRDWIMEGLQAFWDRLTRAWRGVDRLREVEMHKRRHADAMLELGRRHILPWRLLGEMDKVWSTAVDSGKVLWLPDTVNSEQWGFQRSVWDWYNSVTHCIKRLSPVSQFASLRGAMTLAQDVCPSSATSA